MIRNAVAVIVALIVGSLANFAVISLSNLIYPLPAGVDPGDIEALKAHYADHGIATGAMLLVLVAHAGGSFVSGAVCGFVAGHRWYAAAVGLGLLWTAGGLSMLMMIPAPVWFAVADLGLYIPAAMLGMRLVPEEPPRAREPHAP